MPFAFLRRRTSVALRFALMVVVTRSLTSISAKVAGSVNMESVLARRKGRKIGTHMAIPRLVGEENGAFNTMHAGKDGDGLCLVCLLCLSLPFHCRESGSFHYYVSV